MPKVSKESATQGGEFGPVTDRAEQLGELHGQLHVVRRAHRRDAAAAEGSPTIAASARTGATCSSGRIAFVYADREEVFEAGDAFYTPPGHAPVIREPAPSS